MRGGKSVTKAKSFTTQIMKTRKHDYETENQETGGAKHETRETEKKITRKEKITRQEKKYQARNMKQKIQIAIQETKIGRANGETKKNNNNHHNTHEWK